MHIADVLDDLAADLRATGRQPTTGATEAQILQTVATAMVRRAAQVRVTEQETVDAEARRQARDDAERLAAAEKASAERAEADLAAQGAADAGAVGGQVREQGPGSYDPARYTVNEVNDHLRDAEPDERARVLALEDQDRPDVPAGKKQRAGILAGPYAQSTE